MIRAEKNRAATARDPWIAREIARIVRVLERHLAALGARRSPRFSQPASG
jgi:hypothetical protein